MEYKENQLYNVTDKWLILFMKSGKEVWIKGGNEKSYAEEMKYKLLQSLYRPDGEKVIEYTESNDIITKTTGFIVDAIESYEFHVDTTQVIYTQKDGWRDEEYNSVDVRPYMEETLEIVEE